MIYEKTIISLSIFFYREISTTLLSGSVQQNMRYISDLRRKIRKLEEEAAEISQRLNMLLVIS